MLCKWPLPTTAPLCCFRLLHRAENRCCPAVTYILATGHPTCLPWIFYCPLYCNETSLAKGRSWPCMEIDMMTFHIINAYNLELEDPNSLYAMLSLFIQFIFMCHHGQLYVTTGSHILIYCIAIVYIPACVHNHLRWPGPIRGPSWIPSFPISVTCSGISVRLSLSTSFVFQQSKCMST